MGWRDQIADAIRGRPASRKESAAMQAVLSLGPYQAKWMNSDYATFAREGYMSNPYVYAAIRQISMALAGIPWRAYSKPDKKNELDDHPILDLLHRPNPRQAQGRFFENWVGYLLLDGNVYIERAGGAKNGSGLPDELYILRPDRMRIVQGNVAQPVAGYVYRVAGYEATWPAEKILHSKFWHPLDDWYGLSPMQAAAKSIDQSNYSKAWNLSMLQNGARPSGAIVSPDNMEAEQYQRTKEWIEEQHAGFLNAGRVAIIEGGGTWVQMGMSPEDMSWVEGQKLSSREIAIVYSIAPELIGDSANKTYSNYGEARKAMYQECVLPLLDWLRDDLNSWVCEPNGVYIDYDRDEIEALQEDRNAIYTRNNAAFSSGWITINDARSAAGMDEDKEAGDYYRWQLPLNAPADPTAEEPETNVAVGINATGAPLPFPNLPPTHPLNMGPPQIAPPADGSKPGAGADDGKAPAKAEPTDSKLYAMLPFPVRIPASNGHKKAGR